jgi:pilus assembly protein Flp/PilA
MEATMYALIRQFVADETGATSIEYAMIATGICVAIVTIVDGLSLKMNGNYNSVLLAFQ